MRKLIVPLYFASVTFAFLLGQQLPFRQAPVEAVRVTHVLPDSRELTTTRSSISF